MSTLIYIKCLAQHNTNCGARGKFAKVCLANLFSMENGKLLRKNLDITLPKPSQFREDITPSPTWGRLGWGFVRERVHSTIVR